MSIFIKIIVLIIMIVGLVGTLVGNITFMEFIATIYGGVFLYLLGEGINLLKKKRVE